MKVTLWIGGLAAGAVVAGMAFGQEAVQAAVSAAGQDKAAVVVSKKPLEPTRDSIVTAKKIEFDNKEGVILFDENVLVDDAQFLMRSDRLLIFMQGTNDVQQVMAIGNVSITNANRAASCDKAVYTKKDGRIVMTGNAYLKQQGKEAGDVGPAERIVIWIDDERMEVSPGRVVLPPGTFNKGGMQKLLP